MLQLSCHPPLGLNQMCEAWDAIVLRRKFPVQAAPAGAVKAEALRWENRRLAEAKEKLEGLTRDQQRRIIQLEEALSELKSAPGRRCNSLSRTASGTSDPGTPSRRVCLLPFRLLFQKCRAPGSMISAMLPEIMPAWMAALCT